MARTALLDKLSFSSESESELESEIPDYPPDMGGVEPDEESPDEPELEPDPKPKRSKAGRSTVTTAAPKVTAAMRREVRETLQVMLELPVMLWERRDPTCAAVAGEQLEPITDAVLAIIVRRPAWVAAFLDAGASAEWIRLTRALWPVLMTIWAHHVAKTVGQDDGEEGPDGFASYAAPPLA